MSKLCALDSDCPTGEKCIRTAGRVNKYCQPSSDSGLVPLGGKCSSNSQCYTKLCTDGVCTVSCNYDSDCPSSTDKCISGSCIPPPPTCNPQTVTMAPKPPRTAAELDLLNECVYAEATNTDQAALFGCQCMQTMNSIADTFRAYQNAMNGYTCDKTNYDAYLALKKMWDSLRTNEETDLRRQQFVACAIDDTGVKGCGNTNSEWTQVPGSSKDTCFVNVAPVGGTGGGAPVPGWQYTCQFTDDAVNRRLVDWESQHPPPAEVYAPPTPSVFQPGNVQCCSEVWNNVNANMSAVDFENIRQQCVSSISEMMKIVTPSPTSPSSSPSSSPTLPSSSPSSSPTSPSSSPTSSPTSPTPSNEPAFFLGMSKTVTIIVGSILGVLVLALIGAFVSKKSPQTDRSS